MNRAFIILSALFLLSSIGGYAQSQPSSIFDALERQSKPGEGRVIVYQSDAIKRLVGKRTDNENVDVVKGKRHLKTWGYRIQVYSGNNQLVSKAETEKLKAQLEKHFPGLDTYPDFIAPWWKLYVGNFLTLEETEVMKRELQKAFPQIRKEIVTVETYILLPLDN